MSDKKGLLSSGLGMVAHNKRYIVWFYLLNLAFAWWGISAFRSQAQSVLDNSLAADRLLHGFHVAVFIEMLSRPELGPAEAASMSAARFAILFFVATALFLPGVFLGFASTYRLPREDFFRACGRNLWRFIRLLLLAGVVMGAAAGGLFALNSAHVKHAEHSTNELLPFEMQVLGLTVIFLVMTTLRIWFDLTEADIVLSDQRAVRKSIASAFRHTLRNLARLLASYIVCTIVAALILVAGLCAWMKVVKPESVAGAFVIGQITLLLLLIPRFWQRGVAVSFWQQKMLVPVVTPQPFVPQPASISAAPESVSPVASATPPTVSEP